MFQVGPSDQEGGARNRRRGGAHADLRNGRAPSDLEVGLISATWLCGGSVPCRLQRWFPTPRGSLGLERSAVSETPDHSMWDDSGPLAAFNLERQRRGCRWSTRREPAVRRGLDIPYEPTGPTARPRRPLPPERSHGIGRLHGSGPHRLPQCSPPPRPPEPHPRSAHSPRSRRSFR